MTERDANQLAADVRERLRPVQGLDGVQCQCEKCVDNAAGFSALNELVALVGTLQQERDEALKNVDALAKLAGSAQAAFRDIEERNDDLFTGLGRMETRAEAAEAELTRMKDDETLGWGAANRKEARWVAAEERAEAAEAALAEAQQERHEYGVWAEGKIADTRQALKLLLEWAEKDRGGGYPEENRSEEWYTHRDFARRALADTGGDTKESPLAEAKENYERTIYLKDRALATTRQALADFDQRWYPTLAGRAIIESESHHAEAAELWTQLCFDFRALADTGGDSAPWPCEDCDDPTRCLKSRAVDASGQRTHCVAGGDTKEPS